MLRHCLLLAILLPTTAGCQLASSNLEQESADLDAPEIDLIAIGAISGNRADRSAATSGALENGVAGNLLGGIGSGLAHAGGNTFVALPDRGPNAQPYNAAVDETTSYIPRFHTLRLQLKQSPRDAALPFELSAKLKDTTLLFSAEPLVYGSGIAAGLPNGAPALNRRRKNYFSGRSDNFDPARPSTDARDGRFDPESIRVSNDGT